MKINAKKIAAGVLANIDLSESDKTKTSLYLSKSTYKAFKRACSKNGILPSMAIEMLMQGFIEATNDG